MNAITRHHSTCPHDCPSACALLVDVEDNRLLKVRGDPANSYTAGVICAKVAQYSQRIDNPDRLKEPLLRTGPKGNGQFKPIGWDEALDRIAEAFLRAEHTHGAQSVWPYNYAGTMGLVQRDGIHRLRHVKKYSRQHDTICTNMAWSGFTAGTGKLAGPDPREMRVADCVVIWGTNAVATQVNVMTHAVAARRARGATIVAVDVYETDTVRQADVKLIVRPGTDAALACAVMHIAFRDGYADRAYLEKFSDDPHGFEAHLETRTPQWAAAITGLSVEEIEDFGKLLGTTARSYLRLGYGFTRQRNGAIAMHAATSIATVLGSWQYEGGGAFHNNGAIYEMDRGLIMGSDALDPTVRQLDQSRIGAVLCGDADALHAGPPVTAMLIQNTNPLSVAPEQSRVYEGFAREDLFVAVHEQVMTETAKFADIVLPATMFLEHDDIYRGGGHQHIMFGPKIIEPPSDVRDNHFVHCALAERLGAEHRGFQMSACDHIDHMLELGGYDRDAFYRESYIDCQPSFAQSHYLDGFAYPDGKFKFAPDWPTAPSPNNGGGPMGPYGDMPRFPDHWAVLEETTDDAPFRLVTAPARGFLNSTFNETPRSRSKEGRPTVMVNARDAHTLSIDEGALVELWNARGRVRLHAMVSDRIAPGTLVSEGLHANDAFVDGRGINTLTGADSVAPFGGVAFHDNRVSLRPLPAD